MASSNSIKIISDDLHLGEDSIQTLNNYDNIFSNFTSTTMAPSATVEGNWMSYVLVLAAFVLNIGIFIFILRWARRIQVNGTIRDVPSHQRSNMGMRQGSIDLSIATRYYAGRQNMNQVRQTDSSSNTNNQSDNYSGEANLESSSDDFLGVKKDLPPSYEEIVLSPKTLPSIYTEEESNVEGKLIKKGGRECKETEPPSYNNLSFENDELVHD